MIRVFNNCKKYRFDKKETVSLAKCVLKNECSKEYDINFIFVDDKFIYKLNKTFLKHNWVTDVISFQLGEDNKIDGEVYINLEQSRRQAKAYSSTIKSETQRLIIHGVLHLLGFKDNTKKSKNRMSLLEDKYLKKCKIK